jgi:glycosyltransferase involved in cell wall biosynthesis
MSPAVGSDLTMRIGIDAQQLSIDFRSGLYYHTLNLIGGLRAMGGRDRIILFVRHAPDWKRQMTRLRSCVGGLGFPIRRYGVPWAPYRLRLRLNPINRVAVFLYVSDPFFPPSGRRCNVFLVPDLTVLHCPQHHPEGHRRHWGHYIDQVRRHADAVLTFSEHTRADVAATLGIPRERIRAVPLAADSRFRPVADREALGEYSRRWGLEPGNYILSVGTLEPRKNHGLILEAYARLRSRGLLPRGCRLVFAGSRGWLYEPILARIERLGLRDDVVLLGHADPLECLYSGAIMMVYPSLMEGFGLPPLEAMACGTPVITSGVTSLPEVVGEAGIMVDPHDPDGLAEAMARVLGDPALREELRVKGLQRASSFSWGRTAAATLATLHEAHRLWRAG